MPSFLARRMPTAGGASEAYWPPRHAGSERTISRCSERTAMEKGRLRAAEEMRTTPVAASAMQHGEREGGHAAHGGADNGMQSREAQGFDDGVAGVRDVFET